MFESGLGGCMCGSERPGWFVLSDNEVQSWSARLHINLQCLQVNSRMGAALVLQFIIEPNQLTRVVECIHTTMRTDDHVTEQSAVDWSILTTKASVLSPQAARADLQCASAASRIDIGGFNSSTCDLPVTRYE